MLIFFKEQRQHARKNTIPTMTVRVVFLSALCIFAVFIGCRVLVQSSTADVDSARYTTDVVQQNKALAARLCTADRRAAVLYGVFSIAEKVLFRNATRQQVQCHLNGNVHNTVFVVGAPRTEGDHTILKREAAMYGDIFTLSCVENMNLGKSYTYFKEALAQFPCFDFYAKVDDDTAWIPDRLSSFIQTAPRNTPVIIGRYEPAQAINKTWFYVRETVLYGFRDMSWARHIHGYPLGLLYILNAAAVKSWVALNPTDLYSHEDLRTFYYMKLIGAEVINTHAAFHDHMRYTHGVPEWREPITNASLAVHQCKSIDLLVEVFASLCRYETPIF